MGVIYLMSTPIEGLARLDWSPSDQFEKQVQFIENKAAIPLSRAYAIEVDDCKAVMALLWKLLAPYRVRDSLFLAIDLSLLVELLSLLGGRQVYPKVSQENVIKEEQVDQKETNFPGGPWYLTRKVRDFGLVKGTMFYLGDDRWLVKAGSIVNTNGSRNSKRPSRNLYKVADIDPRCVLKTDIVAQSPSGAAGLLVGRNINGWDYWLDENGRTLGSYRAKLQGKDEK